MALTTLEKTQYQFHALLHNQEETDRLIYEWITDRVLDPSRWIRIAVFRAFVKFKIIKYHYYFKDEDIFTEFMLVWGNLVAIH